MLSHTKWMGALVVGTLLVAGCSPKVNDYAMEQACTVAGQMHLGAMSQGTRMIGLGDDTAINVVVSHAGSLRHWGEQAGSKAVEAAGESAQGHLSELADTHSGDYGAFLEGIDSDVLSGYYNDAIAECHDWRMSKG